MSAVAEYAASEMRYWCVTDAYGGVGYSQPRRWSAYDASDWAGWLRGPGEMDCSAGVAGAYNISWHECLGEGERPEPFPRDTYTGNLRAYALARGFTDIGDSWTGSVPDGGLAVGDLLLVDPGHVAMVVRDLDGGFDPDDPLLAEAWIDAAGDIDGSTGDDGSTADDTGGETRLIRYSDHPRTTSATWSTCLRYTGAAGATPAPPTAREEWPAPTQGRLTGIDVSSHQDGLDVAGVPCDVVIVKATEGSGYTDPGWRARADAALSAGRLLGLYHFTWNSANSVEEEARTFLDAVGPYVGRAVLILDWEDPDGLADTAWALDWLTRVREATGVTPALYTYSYAVDAHDWAAVAAAGHPLWVAGYPAGAPTVLATPDCPYGTAPWGAPIAWQYTSEGAVPGYGRGVDLDVVYVSREEWQSLAGSPSGWVPLTVDGVWGPATARRLRQVMGVPEDAPWETACRALQYALSWQVDAYRLTEATGSDRLPVTGVDDDATWDAFRAWWNHCGIPAGHKIPVTGGYDTAVIEAVQITLNHSWAGSRGLAVRP